MCETASRYPGSGFSNWNGCRKAQETGPSVQFEAMPVGNRRRGMGWISGNWEAGVGQRSGLPQIHQVFLLQHFNLLADLSVGNADRDLQAGGDCGRQVVIGVKSIVF